MSLFFGIAFWGAAVRVLSTRSFSLYLVLLTLFSSTNGYSILRNLGSALLGKHFAVERSLWVVGITPGPNHSWTSCKEWGKTGRMLADLPENQRCGISSHWLATEHFTLSHHLDFDWGEHCFDWVTNATDCSKFLCCSVARSTPWVHWKKSIVGRNSCNWSFQSLVVHITWRTANHIRIK